MDITEMAVKLKTTVLFLKIFTEITKEECLNIPREKRKNKVPLDRIYNFLIK